MYAGFLDLTLPLWWTVDDALPPALTDRYAHRMITATDAEPGLISGGVYDPVRRNNTRVMWDDASEADGLLERVRDHVPTEMSGRHLAGANPRLRLYRYTAGQRHSAHWDTIVTLPDGRRSQLTLVVYLNDGFEGGETEFPELGEVVAPRRGRALLFQHRVLHRASEVRSGEKVVLRTDVLYR
ncbi:MAG: 2OG-Fe(II) oxygenase [Myxococcota bacterium]